MLLGFFDLCFELCLPFLSTFLIIAVFLELSSSSIPRYANLYHHCAVFLLSSFTSPLLCWDFQKASCSSVATLCPGPSSQERFFCLFALCPEEPCLFSYNTQAISRLYMCSFDFLDNSFSQDRFHSLHGVCSPYILLLVGTNLYLLLSAVATLGFCFVSQTSSVSLLSTS